jgi:mRNA-degrading endonuclease RelE of RelBE toxin-antitoxin system
MNSLTAFNKWSMLPKNLQKEVLDFIEFLLSKQNKPEQTPKPKFGSAKGMFKMMPDFDEPLDDFKEYMH